MGYKLKPQKALPKEIRRIVTEQSDKALAALRSTELSPDEIVHDVRKRFKKIRAVLRLVRDEMGEKVYQRENSFYRDQGRRLATLRDSYVYGETVALLEEKFDDLLYKDAFAHLHKALTARHAALREELLADGELFAAIAADLADAQCRIADWPLDENSFDAIDASLQRVYERGYDARTAAYKAGTAERFHEWRKRAKYLRYQLRILKPLWPGLLAPTCDELHNLTDYLGDDHNLADLMATIRATPDLCADETHRRALEGLLIKEQTRLQQKAERLGRRLYAEKPNVFVKRIEAYWNAVQATST